jgi:integrase
VGRKPKRPAYKPYTVGEYRLGWFRDCFCATWYEGSERRRHRLGVRTEEQGRQELHAFARSHLAYTEGTSVPTIQRLVDQYIADRETDGKSVNNARWRWSALKEDFGPLTGADITKAICRAYHKKRLDMGKKPGTPHSEMGLLKTVLNWAAAEKLIAPVTAFWMPQKPEPRDRHLTLQEVERLLEAADLPHIRLFIILALATAARKTAILDLTWMRVDFERALIYLQDPEQRRTNKGRAVVPMNSTARAALLEAKAGGVSDYVVEWGGRRVRDVKKGIATAFLKAGLKERGDGAHVLRHTAAVLMAEAGVSMEEIAQYFGHSNVLTTYRVYARFSPEYLKKAASALELPTIRSSGRK